MTNHELRCEKCDRPAEVVGRRIGRQRSGHETVNRTIVKVCECGGQGCAGDVIAVAETY